jgi:hypothetical protein
MEHHRTGLGWVDVPRFLQGQDLNNKINRIRTPPYHALSLGAQAHRGIRPCETGLAALAGWVGVQRESLMATPQCHPTAHDGTDLTMWRQGSSPASLPVLSPMLVTFFFPLSLLPFHLTLGMNSTNFRTALVQYTRSRFSIYEHASFPQHTPLRV